MRCELSAVALALLASGQAFGRPVEDAVRFQYEAPAECPDEAAFVARVRERTARGRPAEQGELARTFFLKIRSDEQGFSGGIEFLDEGGAPVSRQVRGEQCDAVVTSLALITALSLDSTLNEQESEPPSTVSREPSAPRSPGPPPSLMSAKRPSPRLPVPPLATKRTGRPLGARLGASASYGTAIEAWTFALVGQLDWPSGFGLRFAPHYATDERTVDSGRRAELRLLGLRASGCYFVLRVDALTLTPCAGFDFGSLRARGLRSQALPDASSKTVAWAAVGPELRVSWEPVASYWLELNGDLQFPLMPHEFRFDVPSRSVYAVPWIAASLGLATGVRFW